ncbi:hypothetical protein CDL15_Pgr018714 [Punica granatum]|uniref:Uncharacterized protein n=1 Tax=Punica granatum TaxID=22663 RepID=A0A218VUZ4_PUNGR|nr:hypothetical protein CDL15_Pgr018714 [Punica granatum]
MVTSIDYIFFMFFTDESVTVESISSSWVDSLIRLGVKPTSLGRKDFVMRIVGTMMGLKHTSSEVGFVKRELMHKISETYMFRVDQSHERRQDKSSKLWRAHLRVSWAKRRLIRIGL